MWPGTAVPAMWLGQWNKDGQRPVEVSRKSEYIRNQK